MKSAKANLLTEVAGYYSSKLQRYGETPQGVDWNGEQSQIIRFSQICKILDSPAPYSVNDLGCGYGALYDFLESCHEPFSYCGIDVSEDMVRAARQRYANKEQARFVVSDRPDRMADYGMASGIFNVRLDRGNEEWKSYLEATLEVLDRTSRLGFAFNCLTSYSDPGKMRANLYYADPCELFDLCKRRYSKNVALLHDYGLYEFTILVRKLP